jgi:hypothetical protein
MKIAPFFARLLRGQDASTNKLSASKSQEVPPAISCNLSYPVTSSRPKFKLACQFSANEFVLFREIKTQINSMFFELNAMSVVKVNCLKAQQDWISGRKDSLYFSLSKPPSS